ncbi:MAG: hypothetical protein HYV07_24535 [Deltaproteobacteria bacterium]|nr:hypothetical protein [Deltaproteobacteria bacterium]
MSSRPRRDARGRPASQPRAHIESRRRQTGRQEDGWRCGPKTPFDLVYGGEPLQLQFFDSAIFARSAVFAEFEATQGARTGRGLAMIPLEGLSRPSGALDFRILRFDLAGAPLSSLVAFPNDDTRALALQGDRAYVLGDSGIEDEFSIGVGPKTNSTSSPARSRSP